MKRLAELMDAALRKAAEARAPEPPPPTEDQLLKAAEKLIARGYLPYDRESFAALCGYVARRDANTMKRGLWVFGKAGVGKTQLLKAAVDRGKVVTAYEMVSAYKAEQDTTDAFWCRVTGMDKCFWPDYCGKPARWYLDDVGQEPTCVIYGERIEVFDLVLHGLYIAWQSHGCMLHLSSNLTPEEMDRRYGRRVTDRLREMCCCFEIGGKSRRGDA